MSNDLISSAVNFLQDPKVANEPLAKRIAFLESKGLSSDQVQIALQRARQASQASSSTTEPSPSVQDSSAAYSPPVPPSNYVTYRQQAPPPMSQRDWRDWFIMAIVSSGFSWAAYLIAKRYVLPLISPPTPTQLDTDKETISAQFDQVQEMLSILQKDTEQVKEQNAEQNKKIEDSLSEVDAAVRDMQEKAARRETDIRRLGLELDQIRDLIPKAIGAVKSAQGEALSDLGGELRSLKTLLQNRLKATSAPFSSTNSNSSTPVSNSAPSTSNTISSNTSSSSTAAPVTGTSSTGSVTAVAPSNAKSTTTDPLARFSARGGNGIPDWQKSAPSVPSASNSQGPFNSGEESNVNGSHDDDQATSVQATT